MGLWKCSPLNVTVLAGAAILGGCNGSVSPGGGTVQAARSMIGAQNAGAQRTSLNGEILTASSVRFYPDCQTGCEPFSASGTAQGPYPGTFTASGSWGHRIIGYNFLEDFTITSGSSTVSGQASWRMKHFGQDYRFSGSGPYTSNVGSGHTRVSIRKAYFREDFVP